MKHSPGNWELGIGNLYDRPAVLVIVIDHRTTGCLSLIQQIKVAVKIPTSLLVGKEIIKMYNTANRIFERT